MVKKAFPVLCTVSKEFEPNLILHGGEELSGGLVAEELDVPHVSMPSGASNTFAEIAAEWLNEQRKVFDLAAKGDPLTMYQYRRPSCAPKRYSLTIGQPPEASPSSSRLGPSSSLETPVRYSLRAVVAWQGIEFLDSNDRRGNMIDSTVLIVGAGPTGLGLACGLRRQGISVRVVDSANGPIGTSRALGVQPRGVEVLIRLGALGDLPKRALIVDEVEMYVDRRLVSTMPLDRMGAASGRSPLLISQAAVESELRRRFTELGGHVDWEHTLVDAAQDTLCVTATLHSKQGLETVRADWLIGCDGAHSTVRKLAGIDFPGTTVAECFLLADVLSSWDSNRRIVTSWTNGGDMISVCPLPGAKRWRLMGPAPTGITADLSEEQVQTLIEQQLTKCSPFRSADIERVEWLSSFRIHRRLASSYRRGRMFLAGDAAAIHHPFGGQGMNTGLGDAENLAWKLGLVASGRANDQLLDTYEGERRPVANGVVAATSAITRLVMADTPILRVLRDRLVLPLTNHPKAQNFLWRNSSQLDIHYRGGPLATKPGRFSYKLRPGERVPDIACRHADGTPTTLHGALDGRWALLATPANKGSLASAENRLGHNNIVPLTPISGRLTDVMLIRPDAHLAWRGRPASTKLSHWLADALECGAAD